MDKIESQEQQCPTRNHDVIVMVRAAGDEPVLLSVVANDRDYIEMEGSQPGNTIRFPRSRVYSYNQTAFNALEVAYSDGDTARIKAHWNRCDIYD